jgi:hypothetical protein
VKPSKQEIHAEICNEDAQEGEDAEDMEMLRISEPFPKNDIAESCIKDLHSYGVGTKHCIFGGDRLGIYFLETGAVARPSEPITKVSYAKI